MNRKLLSYGAVFLMVSALTVLVRTGRSQTPQEKEGDPHSIVRDKMVQVQVEVLSLHGGFPEGGSQ